MLIFDGCLVQKNGHMTITILSIAQYIKILLLIGPFLHLYGGSQCVESLLLIGPFPRYLSLHKVGVTHYQHPYVSILLSSQMSDEKNFKHLLAEGRKGGILLS
jgi:hypothetical protein